MGVHTKINTNSLKVFGEESQMNEFHEKIYLHFK